LERRRSPRRHPDVVDLTGLRAGECAREHGVDRGCPRPAGSALRTHGCSRGLFRSRSDAPHLRKPDRRALPFRRQQSRHQQADAGVDQGIRTKPRRPVVATLPLLPARSMTQSGGCALPQQARGPHSAMVGQTPRCRGEIQGFPSGSRPDRTSRPLGLTGAALPGRSDWAKAMATARPLAGARSWSAGPMVGLISTQTPRLRLRAVRSTRGRPSPRRSCARWPKPQARAAALRRRWSCRAAERFEDLSRASAERQGRCPARPDARRRPFAPRPEAARPPRWRTSPHLPAKLRRICRSLPSSAMIEPSPALRRPGDFEALSWALGS